MTCEEILDFLNDNPVFFLATVKDDKPYVRGMMLYQADAQGIVFGSRTGKELHRQLVENPAVELCFYNPEGNRQVRVGGSVEFLEDPATKAKLADRFPFLRKTLVDSGLEAITLYRMRSGIATAWTPETDAAPKIFVDL